MGMIDQQYKDHEFKRLQEENKKLFEQIQNWKQMYRTLWKRNMMNEKLIELNMSDLWDIADQRDWYYDRYQNLKEKYSNSQTKKAIK